MVIVFVVLAIIGFVSASWLFGADSRYVDSRCATPDWPGVRHSS